MSQLATPALSAPAWETATASEAGFTGDVAAQLDAAMAAGSLKNLHAVLVVRNGKLVFERYYDGIDERWGQSLGHLLFDAETKHDLRSVSKSIVGLLYGIALDRGRAPALEIPILESFPEYKDLAADPKRLRMTVADALTMRLGTEWNEDPPYSDPRNSEIAMELAPDRYRFVLERPFVTEPGKQWDYNGGATALLAALIERGSGQSIFEFAKENLFQPLGVEDVEWVKGSDGAFAAASGLRMRPRDLARVGQVVLNRGEWQGEKLIPEDWLEAAFTPRTRVDEGIEYGYQWWLGKLRDSGAPWMAAFGNGGQRLILIPSLDLAVVVTAGNYNQPDAWKLPVRIMADYILPALAQP